VKLTLKPGQELHHTCGGPTDEGWHREWNKWSFDGRYVTSEWLSDGVDCDGRLEQFGTSICALAELHAGYVDEALCVTYPAWRDTEAGQRDHAAEAMGY